MALFGPLFGPFPLRFWGVLKSGTFPFLHRDFKKFFSKIGPKIKFLTRGSFENVFQVLSLKFFTVTGKKMSQEEV